MYLNKTKDKIQGSHFFHRLAIAAIAAMLLVPVATSGSFFADAATGATHTLTVEAYDQYGNVRHMYATISPGLGGYTPLSFAGTDSVAYTVTVHDYQDRVFDHWGDGSTARTRTVTLTADSKLVAYYKSGTSAALGTRTLTVKSVDMQNNPVAGLYTTIRSGSTVVKTGYTPLAFAGNQGTSYTVAVADYGSYAFDHWENGSTSRTRTMTLNSDATMSASYSTGSPSPSPSPGGSTDRFGVKMLYPTQQGGRTWDAKWDNGVARSFGNSKNDPSDSLFKTAGLGDGSFNTSGDGILKISGKYPRMYVFDQTKDWHNVEITVYGQRVSDTNISWAGIQAYARTNHGAIGSEDTNNCDTRGYGAQLTYPGKFLFEKETSHHADNGYAQAGQKTVWSGGMPKNQWVGYKFVVRDVDNGQHVRLETYMDTTGGLNGGNWVKVGDFTDTGSNFGTNNAACKSGVNPGLPLTSSNARAGSETGRPNVAVYFRSDGVGTDGLLYKWASIREVAPLA